MSDWSQCDKPKCRYCDHADPFVQNTSVPPKKPDYSWRTPIPTDQTTDPAHPDPIVAIDDPVPDPEDSPSWVPRCITPSPSYLPSLPRRMPFETNIERHSWIRRRNIDTLNMYIPRSPSRTSSSSPIGGRSRFQLLGLRRYRDTDSLGGSPTPPSRHGHPPKIDQKSIRNWLDSCPSACVSQHNVSNLGINSNRRDVRWSGINTQREIALREEVEDYFDPYSDYYSTSSPVYSASSSSFGTDTSNCRSTRSLPPTCVPSPAADRRVRSASLPGTKYREPARDFVPTCAPRTPRMDPSLKWCDSDDE